MYYTPDTIPDEAADALRPAFDRSDVHMIEEWIQRCKNDKAQLWKMRSYWMITEVVQTKNGLALHMLASAGVYENDLIEEAENWAREIGCKSAYFTGRPGSIKRRPDYKIRTVTMQ